MTLKDIERRVEHIRQIAGDYEAAHAAADSLQIDFISYVASLKSPLAERAKAIHAVEEISFARHCA